MYLINEIFRKKFSIYMHIFNDLTMTTYYLICCNFWNKISHIFYIYSAFDLCLMLWRDIFSFHNHKNYIIYLVEIWRKVDVCKGKYLLYTQYNGIAYHSSEIRGLCLMKWPCKTLQNLPYFWNTISDNTHSFFGFRFSFSCYFIFP